MLNDPGTYSSERGGHRRHGGTLIQDLPMAGVVLNMFDAVEPGFDYREGRDVTHTTDEIEAARRLMADYGARLIAAKRARPTDDMPSVVVHATLRDVDPPTAVRRRVVLVLRPPLRGGIGHDRGLPLPAV